MEKRLFHQSIIRKRDARITQLHHSTRNSRPTKHFKHERSSHATQAKYLILHTPAEDNPTETCRNLQNTIIKTNAYKSKNNRFVCVCALV